MNGPPVDGAAAVAAMVDLANDLTFRHLADRDGLSVSAFLVVNRLRRQGPMRLTALAEAEYASQSGMTQLVQRLERHGLVKRDSDPEDGRASLVRLDDGGRRLWQSRVETRRERVAALLSTVSEEDQVALWLAAQVVTRVLGEMHSAAGLQLHHADE